MTETVRVIWDGLRKFGIATGPGEAQFFVPGINEVPREVWEKLTGDKTCAVNIHLKGGLLRLASDEVQEVENFTDIGEMTADGAIEVVGELMDENALERARAQEINRPKKPRKSVMAALDDRAELFAVLAGGEKDGGGEE